MMRFKVNDPRLSRNAREQVDKHLSNYKKYNSLYEYVEKNIGVVTSGEPFEGPKYRSKAERWYADTLTVLSRDIKSKVISFRYEAVKLKVGEQDGKSYWYIPDFVVECGDKDTPPVSGPPLRWIEYHEVKGYHKGRERGLAKFRAAQAMYPFWKFVLVEK